MSPAQALLLLRLIEIGYMTICLRWIIMSPPSRLRTTRLWACWIIINLNIAAIIIAVGWLKVILW